MAARMANVLPYMVGSSVPCVFRAAMRVNPDVRDRSHRESRGCVIAIPMAGSSTTRNIETGRQQMRLHSGSLILLLTFAHPLSAQRIGEPEPVRLLGTSTPLTLEFSDRDYLMILYSLHSDVPPDLKESPEYAILCFQYLGRRRFRGCSRSRREVFATVDRRSGSAASKTGAGARPPRTRNRRIPTSGDESRATSGRRPPV